MIYLLDTNVCIQLLNGTSPVLLKRFRAKRPAELAVCSVVKAELWAGVRRSGRVEANLKRLTTFFSPLQSLAFDDTCAEHYGHIYAELTSRGTPIGPNDNLIAAIARAHQATLVTNNVGEFSRVLGLRIEDWQAA